MAAISEVKLTYFINSSTKYALLKSQKWINFLFIWSANTSPRLKVYMENPPMSLQWTLPSPCSLKIIRETHLFFEKELFNILQKQDLMPQPPKIETFYFK